MKNAILFLVALSLTLSGCFSEPQVTDTTTLPQPEATVPTSQTAEATEASTDYEAPMLSFSAPTVTQTLEGGAGTALLTFTTQTMELLMEDPQISEAVTLDFLNLTDFEATSGPKLLKEAREAASAQENWSPYSLQILFSPARLDRSVLSLVSTQVVSDGNPKATVNIGSVTYDLLSGRQVQLKDVLVPEYSAETLSGLIVESLKGLSEQGMLYSDYAYVIGDMFSSNTPIKSWYLSGEGLCFYFAPYEIAPYNMGFVTATVPYTALADLLRAEFFPDESVLLKGTVLCREAQEDLESFSQFRELVLDPSGGEWLIHTDGAVEDLRLESGSYSGGEFLPEATVFACATLCPGDALILQASEEQFSALRLIYQSQGETVALRLSDLLKN